MGFAFRKVAPLQAIRAHESRLSRTPADRRQPAVPIVRAAPRRTAPWRLWPGSRIADRRRISAARAAGSHGTERQLAALALPSLSGHAAPGLAPRMGRRSDWLDGGLARRAVCADLATPCRAAGLWPGVDVEALAVADDLAAADGRSDPAGREIAKCRRGWIEGSFGVCP